MQNEPNIQWNDLTKFIGQLNHDLRNHLNAVELQSAFLNEIVPSGEAKDEIKRLRVMTGELGAHLQKLSTLMGRIQPRPMRYLGREFFEDLQSKLAQEQPEVAPAVKWKMSLGEEAVEIDPHLLQEAFLELFRNAAQHGRAEGPLVFEAQREGDTLEFRLCEPKQDFSAETENWGRQPLGKMGSGHYGLGLFRARSIFEAHHGQLRAHFDPATSTLHTTVALPHLA